MGKDIRPRMWNLHPMNPRCAGLATSFTDLRIFSAFLYYPCAGEIRATSGFVCTKGERNAQFGTPEDVTREIQVGVALSWTPKTLKNDQRRGYETSSNGRDEKEGGRGFIPVNNRWGIVLCPPYVPALANLGFTPWTMNPLHFPGNESHAE